MFFSNTLSSTRNYVFADLVESASNTSLLRFRGTPVPNGNRIWLKAEFTNPTGSIYDRIYPTLIKDAENRCLILPGVTPLIEVSAGNAGAAFARCCRASGYTDYTVVTPADAPKPRMDHMTSLGARLVFGPAGLYAKGCIAVLEEILAQDKIDKGGKMGDDFRRLYCPSKISPLTLSSYARIVDEIYEDGQSIDIFVGVVGSGGSLSGIGRRLKQINRLAKVVAVDPIETPMVSGFLCNGRPVDSPRLLHALYGAGLFGVPLEKLNLDLSVIDDVRLVTTQEWQQGRAILIEQEGLDVGRTSGAAVIKALEIACRVANKNILVVLYDAGWKY